MSPLTLFDKPEKPKRAPRVPRIERPPTETSTTEQDTDRFETTPKKPVAKSTKAVRREPAVPKIDTPKNAAKGKGAAAKKTAPAKETVNIEHDRSPALRERGTALVSRYGLYVIIGILALFITSRFRPSPVAPAMSVIFTAEVQHWQTQILSWAAQYGLDPNLIATIMQIESCGRPTAASGVGAQGLFQVMPFNFAADVTNPLDPNANAKAGLGVLRDCLRYASNDVSKTLACYNGGPSLVYQSFNNWPNESQRYATWGAGIYNDAVTHITHSSALDNWLTAGGVGLCQDASVALGLSTPLSGSTADNVAFAAQASALPTYHAAQPIIPPTVTPSVKIFLTPSG